MCRNAHRLSLTAIVIREKYSPEKNPTGFVSFNAHKSMFLNIVGQQCFRKAFIEKTVRCCWRWWELVLWES